MDIVEGLNSPCLSWVFLKQLPLTCLHLAILFFVVVVVFFVFFVLCEHVFVF